MKKNSTIYSVLCLVAVVGLAAGACSSTQTAGQQLDDRTITTKVTSKLTANQEVNPFNIDVDTIDGVVTLRGEVEKQFAKDEAERLAMNTTGVKQIRNLIRVVPEGLEDNQPMTDAWITTKVKSKLTADPDLNPFNIDVDTEDGIVTLSGKVRSAAARAEAEKLARTTKGVIDVENELQVVERNG